MNDSYPRPDAGDLDPTPPRWRPTAIDSLLAKLALPRDRVAVLALDGRGGNGKSTLVDRIVSAHGHAAIVHTDDIAWHHSMFDWTDALIDGVISPVRGGNGVRYRPPGWEAKERPGWIEVPGGVELLLVEGVGAGQRAMSPELDGLIWVHTDFDEARRRGLARDIAESANGESAAENERFWDEWMAAEIAFFATERPWERADAVVAGAAVIPLPDGQIAVGVG